MKKEKTIQNSFKSYLDQSKSLKRRSGRSMKGTLALLTPLAACALIGTDINAQCGDGAFDPSGGSYGDGQLDINGDGTPDFDFDVYCYSSGGGSATSIYLYMTVVGTMNFGTANLGSGVTITPADASVTSSFANIFATYNSAGIPATSFYIAVSTDAGEVGFVEINIDPAAGCPGFTVNIASSGMEDPGGGSDGIGTAVTGACATLPVELVSFRVESNNTGHHLSWATASETDNKGFEIERSMNGVDFKHVGWVNGEGNSSFDLDYGFVDRNIDANTDYYYRLKQVDFNGNYEYSETISARFDDANAISIGTLAPNPVKGDSYINVYASEDGIASLEIYSGAGQLIKQYSPGINSGSNMLKVPSTNLTSGVYYLKIEVQGQVSYQKLTVI